MPRRAKMTIRGYRKHADAAIRSGRCAFIQVDRKVSDSGTIIKRNEVTNLDTGEVVEIVTTFERNGQRATVHEFPTNANCKGTGRNAAVLYRTLTCPWTSKPKSGDMRPVTYKYPENAKRAAERFVDYWNAYYSENPHGPNYNA